MILGQETKKKLGAEIQPRILVNFNPENKTI